MSKDLALELFEEVGEVLFKDDWYIITEKGLTIIVDPKEITWRMSRDLGAKLGRMRTVIYFAIADYCRLMEYRWGDKWTDLAGLFPAYSISRLLNIQWVGNKIEKSRRREHLIFEHHSSVASLPPEQQDKMLDMAEHVQFTRDDFRQAVRAEKHEDERIVSIYWRKYAIEAAIQKCDTALSRTSGTINDHIKLAVTSLRDALHELDLAEQEIKDEQLKLELEKEKDDEEPVSQDP